MTTNNSVNTYIVPTVNNEVTMPLQPAFSAFNDALRNNVTGDGTVYTVPFNDDSSANFFDQNADYNNGTYTFTAPVAGIYYFVTTVTCSGVVGAHTDGAVHFFVNGVGWNADVFNPGAAVGAAGFVTFNGTLLISLAATNTVLVRLQVLNGALAVDVQAGNQTRFSGTLIT